MLGNLFLLANVASALVAKAVPDFAVGQERVNVNLSCNPILVLFFANVN